MQPGSCSLSVRQGDTLALTITLTNPAVGQPTTPGTPIDVTGAAAQFILRSLAHPTAVQIVVLSATPTANGSSLLLGGTAGTLALTLTSGDTATLQTGLYDLRVQFPNGTTQTYLTGSLAVSGEAETWAQAQ